MKAIEDMLNNLKIPRLEKAEFFNRLRVDLMQTFVNPQRVYRLRYNWAVSIAAVLFILLVIAFTSPGVVAKVNAFAFGEKENSPGQEILVQEESGYQGIQYNEASTSITQKNPNLLSPEKTYMIKQYDSRQGRIMIVSEYDRQQQNKIIRKVSAGCY